jgi:hypothetical protein
MNEPVDLETLRKDVERQIIHLRGMLACGADRYTRNQLRGQIEEELELATAERVLAMISRVEALEQTNAELTKAVQGNALAAMRIATSRAEAALGDAPIVAVAGRLETTLAAFTQRCDRLLADEQEKIAPDNALIAVLCDAVRLAREYVELARQPIALGDAVARPQPPTCATCQHWMPDDRADFRAVCGMGVSGSSAEKSSHHPYPITRADFGCTLWSPRPTQEGDAQA